MVFVDRSVALVLKRCLDKLTFRRIGICILMRNRGHSRVERSNALLI